MTIATTPNIQTFTGDGVMTDFPFSFAVQIDPTTGQLLRSGDIQVFINGVQLFTGFTVAVNPNGVGGSVSIAVPPNLNDAGIIARIVPLTQDETLSQEGVIPAQTIEGMSDRLTMEVQQLNEAVGRAATIPLGVAYGPNPPSGQLPAPIANAILGWDPSGTFLQSLTPAQVAILAALGPIIPNPGPDDDILVWEGGVLVNKTPAQVVNLVVPPPSGDVVHPTVAPTSNYAMANYDTVVDASGKKLRATAMGPNGTIWKSNGPGAAGSWIAVPGSVLAADLGKNKTITENQYNTLAVKLSNGQVVAGGNGLGSGIGTNDTVSPFTPLQWDAIHSPPVGATIVDWVQTGSNIYAVLSDGNVYAAGQNTSGQLGQGDTLARSVMTRVPYFPANGISISKVFANPGGFNQALGSVFFVSSANKVYACGYNADGQLGDNTTADKKTPVLVYDAAANTVTDIKVALASHGFTAMLLSDGTVHVTGYNSNGQLGQGNTATLHVFTGVAGIAGATAIDVFQSYNPSSAAITGNMMVITSAAGGSLFVWGANLYYQGANGTTVNKTAPGAVLLTGVASAGFAGAAPYIAVFARLTNSDFYCWGNNGQNNLFANNTTTIQVPTRRFTGTAAAAWGWRSSAANAYPMLYVLDTANILRLASLDFANAVFATQQDTVFAATGVYRCCVPHEVFNQDDTITDLIFVNAAVAKFIKGYLLTSSGALFGGGYSSDGQITNWLKTVDVNGHMYGHRMNKYLWGN